MIELIPAISNAMLVTKNLMDISKKIGDAELKNAIADLSLQLAQAKTEMAEIHTRLLEKDTEINALQRKLENKSKTVGFLNARYYISESGEPIGQPFCPVCFAKSHELYPLINWNRQANTNKCGVCGNTVDYRMSPLCAEQYIELQRKAARELGQKYELIINV